MSVVDLRARRAGFGVDRLSLSFPLAAAPDSSRFGRVQRVIGAQGEIDASYSVNVPLTTKPADRPTLRDVVTSSVFVGAAVVNGSWWGKVEANPARFGDPEGCSLLNIDELAGVGQFMHDVACDVLRPAGEVEDARVKRIDLARDFRGVRSPGGYVWGLLNVKRPYAKRQYVYSDTARRNAETLWAGSGAGGVRLYDQHAAYADKGAPEGSLRWEVEARGDWIAREGKSLSVNFGALTGTQGVSRLVDLAEQRWEWSGMGTEVSSTSDVITRVEGMVAAGGFVDDEGRWRPFSRAKADRVLGQLLRESRGLVRSSARATEADYNRVKKALGCVITPQLFAEQDDAPVGRLDWSTGLEVAA